MWYQYSIFHSKHPLKAIVSARQVGKSWIIAIKAIVKALTEPGSRILVISPTKEQSKYTYDKIKLIMNADPFVDFMIDRFTAYKLFLRNGSEIRVLPCGKEGKSFKGYTADLLIIDEAADVPDPAFDEAFFCTQGVNGDMILISNPTFAYGSFYQCYTSEKFWSRKYTFLDCTFHREDTLSLAQSVDSIDVSKQLWAEFQDEGSLYFGHELEDSVERYDRHVQYTHGYDYIIGIDWGKKHAKTSVTLISIDVNGNLRVEDNFVTQGDYTDSVEQIKALWFKFHSPIIYADETGVGTAPNDELERQDVPVERFSFTSGSKLNIYSTLKSKLIKRQLVLHEDFKDLFREMRQICQYSGTGSARTKVEKPRHSKHARDDHCFVAGTNVLTRKGQIPIEQIKQGDLVLTRDGYKKVLNVGCRPAKVINKLGLRGTPEHPMITTNGIKALSNINVSDVIYIWNEKQSCIMEFPITGIQIQKEDSIESTIGLTQNMYLNHYIGKYGKIISDQSKKVLLSITRMGTPLIMPLKTLNYLQKENTVHSTYNLKNEKQNQEELLSCMQDQKQLSGISQKKEESGIRNITKQLLGLPKRMYSHVLNAEQNLNQSGRKERYTVQENVHRDTSQKQADTLLPEHANGALKILKRINIGPLKHVLQNVQLILERKENVYNLTVEGTHEYFANNILVHNCDSIALAVWGAREATDCSIVVGRARNS